MKHILYLFLILISLSCSKGQGEFSELGKSEVIKNHFDKDDVRELNKVLEFFDDHVCNSVQIETENLDDCYKAFFSKNITESDKGNFFINIQYEKQLDLFNKISPSLFDKIWYFGKTWTHDSGDTLKTLNLKTKGSYPSLLKEIAQTNKGIEYYYNALINSGTISPSMVGNFTYNSSKYDIRKPEIRLIFAIHYLTLYDQYLRSEKYE